MGPLVYYAYYFTFTILSVMSSSPTPTAHLGTEQTVWHLSEAVTETTSTLEQAIRDLSLKLQHDILILDSTLQVADFAGRLVSPSLRQLVSYRLQTSKDTASRLVPLWMQFTRQR